VDFSAGILEQSWSVAGYRTALFLDVGANYGTHSVLFLSAGIPVIAFEPNPACFSYFQTVCELNGLTGRWEHVAIGNDGGQIELVYPDKETWLGSVSSEVAFTLKKSTFVKTQHVPLKKLDDYCSDIHNNVLIKIDVGLRTRGHSRGFPTAPVLQTKTYI
jgi:FkbM family methyltransferase